jgi:hypothetical protein
MADPAAPADLDTFDQAAEGPARLQALADILAHQQAQPAPADDDDPFVGTVRVGARGDAVAYGADGKRIGSFSSAATAAAALKRSDAVKP